MEVYKVKLSFENGDSVIISDQECKEKEITIGQIYTYKKLITETRTSPIFEVEWNTSPVGSSATLILKDGTRIMATENVPITLVGDHSYTIHRIVEIKTRITEMTIIPLCLGELVYETLKTYPHYFKNIHDIPRGSGKTTALKRLAREASGLYIPPYYKFSNKVDYSGTPLFIDEGYSLDELQKFKKEYSVKIALYNPICN
jgi:hypothetical protein